MLIKPFIDHIEGTTGKLSFHGPRCDVNRGLISLVLHVEVRRIVVAEEHRYDDSVERTDLRHGVKSVCNISCKYSNLSAEEQVII